MMGEEGIEIDSIHDEEDEEGKEHDVVVTLPDEAADDTAVPNNKGRKVSKKNLLIGLSVAAFVAMAAALGVVSSRRDDGQMSSMSSAAMHDIEGQADEVGCEEKVVLAKTAGMSKSKKSSSASRDEFAEDNLSDEDNEFAEEAEYAKVNVLSPAPTQTDTIPTYEPTFVETSEKTPSIQSNDEWPLRRALRAGYTVGGVSSSLASKNSLVSSKPRNLHEGWHYINGKSKCSKGTKSSKSSKAMTQPSSAPRSAPSSAPNSLLMEPFLLCRQVPNRPGYGLQEFDSGYSLGQPVFSKLPSMQGNTETTDILDTIQGVLGVASLGFGAIYGPAGVALGAFSGSLGVISQWAGKGETSAISALIQNQFQDTNLAIEKLSLAVKDGFDDIRQDLADVEFDELMASLQAIDFAYEEMKIATLQNDTEIKKRYTDRYRAACNRPHLTPEDLFRQFYGFACGAAGKKRECSANSGGDTGECKFGVKKRQYSLDIYKKVVDGLKTKFEKFGDWLMKAMILSQFHYGACLPEDATSCIDPYTDPIRQGISEDQVASIVEVAANLDRAVTCIDEAFRSTLQDKSFYITNVPGNEKCLKQEGSDGSKNLCMAKATLAVLYDEFPNKNWAVTVYNFESGESGNNEIFDEFGGIVVWKGDETADFGFIHLDQVEGLSNRYFHIMYRTKELGQKDFTNDVDDNALTGVDTGLIPNGVLLRYPGTNADSELNCFGNPLDFRQKQFIVRSEHGNINVLSKEQGYIAFRTNKGVPRSRSSGGDQFQTFFGDEKNIGVFEVPNFTGFTCKDSADLKKSAENFRIDIAV